MPSPTGCGDEMQPNLGLPNGPPLPEPWQAPSELPTDSALPGLGTIRTVGLAGMLPELGLSDGSVTLRLCNYVMGSRATFEARAGERRFAIKLFADDPTSEAELYWRLARVGLAREYGPRVPRLLAWDARLRVLALSWLEGPTVHHLVKEGKGVRAGQLAASWLWHASWRRMRVGPQRSRGHMLYQAGVSAGALGVVQPALGAAARRVAKMLVRVPLKESRPNLVHGTFYARHILDLGDAPGVIDWNQFGVGPIEVDAGMFLATISRFSLRHESYAREVERTKESFLERVRRLVDRRALEWYWAAGLLHLAATGLKTARTREVPGEAPAIIDEAARHARSATDEGSGTPTLARFRFAFHARSPAPTVPVSGSVDTTPPDPPNAQMSDRKE
jgi:phosphotransferase family enzyme